MENYNVRQCQIELMIFYYLAILGNKVNPNVA